MIMRARYDLWNFIRQSIQNKVGIVLLYVVDSNGSSPGRKGFAMAVNAKDEMHGSIGGGIMEHKFVELAKQRIRTRETVSHIRRQVHDKNSAKEQSGMICSGDQTIVLQSLTESDISSIEIVLDAIKKNVPITIELSPAGLAISTQVPDNRFSFNYQSSDDWNYIERISYSEFLHIIGGGHCSLALSELMEKLGFHVTVYDERKDLKTMRENLSAHKKKWVEDYTAISDAIPEGDEHYVVIMTFGYRTDFIALKSIAAKKFRYVGVLGSKKKMESLFQEYRNEGVVREDFIDSVHTPIGIPIKSETPWEIAVSVAAEIISIKNQPL